MTETVEDPKPNTDGADDAAAKAAAAKAEEEKVAAAAAAAAKPKPDKPGKPEDDRKVPERYDLTIPTDSNLGDEHIDQVMAFARENKLTNDEAQKILEKDNAFKAAIIDGQKDELATSRKGWVESAKADSEIGGDKFDESTSLAKRVVDKFGTPAFKKAINESGLGDHPELIRLLTRVGKSLKDDDLVLAGAAPTGKKSIEEVFYGNSKENKKE